MRVKYYIVVPLAYFLLSSFPAAVLAVGCPGSPPGIDCCYICQNGRWVLKEGSECDEHDDCEGVQKCFCTYDDGCKCECDDSEQEPIEIPYDVNVSDMLSCIASSLEQAPCIETVTITFELKGKLTKQNVCCDPDDISYTEEIWGQSTANIGVDIQLDILNAKNFHFEKTFWGRGGIDVSAKLDLGPEINANALGGVGGPYDGDGIFKGCPEWAPCWWADLNAGITIALTATGSGDLKVWSKTGWDWFDDLLTLDVGFIATGSVSVGGGGKVYYYMGDCWYDWGYEPGVDLGCCYIGKCDMRAKITFTIGGKEYNVFSGEECIWDGWKNEECV